MDKEILRQTIINTFKGKNGEEFPELTESSLNEETLIDDYNHISKNTITIY